MAEYKGEKMLRVSSELEKEFTEYFTCLQLFFKRLFYGFSALFQVVSFIKEQTGLYYRSWKSHGINVGRVCKQPGALQPVEVLVDLLIETGVRGTGKPAPKTSVVSLWGCVTSRATLRTSTPPQHHRLRARLVPIAVYC